ncbi:TrbM/KikA/MpfK family conjugal transfer protein [Escherichia coli]|uniref:TrbM/KikA/MpfK family conjugal transfer protein n=1 Tax=Escherichia coli TaxID=562 RepID=UPI001BDC216F
MFTKSGRLFFHFSKKNVRHNKRTKRFFLKYALHRQNRVCLIWLILSARGAGRCDADDLNRNLIETRIAEVNCKTYRIHGDYDCETEVQYRIKNKLPSYCQIYIDNAYTDIGLHYSGSSTRQNKKKTFLNHHLENGLIKQRNYYENFQIKYFNYSTVFLFFLFFR